MLWGILFLFAYIDEKLTFRILFYVCAVLFVGLDGWVFHKLFRKAEQKDLLNNAITCIAKGDTGFRLDTKKLTGKERTVGDHINNIGGSVKETEDTGSQDRLLSGSPGPEIPAFKDIDRGSGRSIQGKFRKPEAGDGRY